MQAHEKGTKLIDEDGLFSLVAAAPDTPSHPVKPDPSPVKPIATGSFYAGKGSTANDASAKRAALAAGSLAASGEHPADVSLFGI